MSLQPCGVGRLMRAVFCRNPNSLLKNSQTCNPKRERGSESTRIQESNSLAYASGYIFQQAAKRLYIDYVRDWLAERRVGLRPSGSARKTPGQTVRTSCFLSPPLRGLPTWLPPAFTRRRVLGLLLRGASHPLGVGLATADSDAEHPLTLPAEGRELKTFDSGAAMT